MADEHPYRAVGQPRPSGAVICPRCKLVCPATTMWCDCGWDFEDQVVHDSPQRRERREGAGGRILAGVLLVVIAVIISIASDRGLVWFGGIIGGLLLIVSGWRRRR